MPNDARDKDIGPNEFMNYPVMVTATADKVSGGTRISGRVDTPLPDGVVVDLYVSAKGGADGLGSRKEYLASAKPDASGRFCAFIAGRDVSDDVVTATATSPLGSTSEFSVPPKYRLVAMEVNQSIQDWENSIPLFKGKKTCVRVFLETKLGTPEVDLYPVSVSPRLHAIRNGKELDDSPVPPDNVILTLKVKPNVAATRTNLSSSLNFSLPTEWCKDKVELWFEADQTCSALEIAGQCEYAGVSVTFKPAPQLQLEVRDVTYYNRGAWVANSAAILYAAIDCAFSNV